MQGEDHLNWIRQQSLRALETVPIAKLIFDEKGICHFANSAAEEFFRVQKGELLNKSVHSIVHNKLTGSPTHEEKYCPLLRPLKGQAQIRRTDIFWRSSGEPVWVEYSCTPVIQENEKKVSALYLSFLEASVVFKRQQEHFHTQAKLRAVFEASVDPLFVVTHTGKIEEANTAASDLFPKKDLHNTNFFMLFPKMYREPLREFWKIGATTSLRNVPLSIIEQGGRELHLEISLVPEVVPKRNLVVLRDRTERITQQRQRDQFMATASHELKTPLAVVKAFSELLTKHLREINDPKGIRYIERISLKTELLTRLINGMMESIKVGTGKLGFQDELIDIDPLVNETVFEMKKAYPSHTIKLTGECRCSVIADRHRLYQVLTNIINNAIKYTPKERPIEVIVSRNETQVLISVKDKGIGITKRELKNLWKPFFRSYRSRQSNVPGLGLGLYLAREIIRRFKGDVHVASRYHHGSAFTIQLPIAEQE